EDVCSSSSIRVVDCRSQPLLPDPRSSTVPCLSYLHKTWVRVLSGSLRENTGPPPTRHGHAAGTPVRFELCERGTHPLPGYLHHPFAQHLVIAAGGTSDTRGAL